MSKSSRSNAKSKTRKASSQRVGSPAAARILTAAASAVRGSIGDLREVAGDDAYPPSLRRKAGSLAAKLSRLHPEQAAVNPSPMRKRGARSSSK